MPAPCEHRGPREVCPGKDQTCGAFSIPTMWAPALVPHPAQNPPTGKATSGPLSPSPHVGEGTKAERGRDLSSVTQRGPELPGPEGSVAWRGRGPGVTLASGWREVRREWGRGLSGIQHSAWNSVGGPGAPLTPRREAQAVQGGDGMVTACRRVGLQLKGQLLPPHCPGEQRTGSRPVTGWSLED